ncbi:MAG: hydroxymethylglutaryl-CoA reductase, degradative [Woeseiaceae bacterium]
MVDSRIPGLYRLDVGQRIDALERAGWLSGEDATALRSGRHVLLTDGADKMIENVIGVLGLPFAIAPNFIVNGKDRLVPMAVEEPSIVAGLSFAAGLARKSGGFEATCEESLLAGQVHVTNLDDVDAAVLSIADARDELLEMANSVHPRLVQRGGGAREIDTRLLALPGGLPAIAVHVLVDTCDAMGANLVNSICEALAPRIAEICKGSVALRILSNLADRSVVTARVAFDADALATAGLDGAAVRDAIVMASDVAAVDAYRAATHNKGVMNGIDAVAIATGNDWRAIEAGAHAFAASGDAYRPLSAWGVGENGELAGEIQVPLKVGIVGGTVTGNPAAALGIRIAGVGSAVQLAELMAAVGLAQNFAALRALATTGIQQGHMRLHARSVVAAAGVPDDKLDEVVAQLVTEGDIQPTRAREIAADMLEPTADDEEPMGVAAGKVILLGEHAVVYGKRALALPIPRAVTASVRESEPGLSLVVPEWGISQQIGARGAEIDAGIRLILRELGIEREHFAIRMHSVLPRATGLGSSAAFAVAVVRAFDVALGLGLSDERVNEVAYTCEKLAHGTPSGIDNTLATYAQPMLFRNANGVDFEALDIGEPLPLLIAICEQRGSTLEQVAGVRARYESSREPYEAIFEQIDALSTAGAAALLDRDFGKLGQLMNINQGLLNAMGVSTPDLEIMVDIARAAGAVGAKLTGAGGGGSIVALCPEKTPQVGSALRAEGYRVMDLTKGREKT